MSDIAFIGLGHMGKPMAKNLIQAGHRLSVFDVMPQAIDSLVALGAVAANSPQKAVKEADVIFTMLQTGSQVEAVCLHEKGFFSAVKENALYIDSSSIEISVTKILHEKAQSQGLAMLDAPVSGGVVGAENASLTFMVGGTQDHFDRAKVYFSLLGKKIVHAGGAGHGQAAKICNNLILGISMIAVSEGFALAEKLQLDPKKFFEISSNASGQCWSMTSYCPEPGLVPSAPSNHAYQAGFMTKMMLKDLRLAQDAAKQSGAVLPLGAEAAELYALFEKEGYGELDFSGIIKMLKGKN